jgi:hypothetical protein
MWNLFKTTFQLVIFEENPPDCSLGIFQYFVSGTCFLSGLLILFGSIYANEFAYYYAHLLFSLICGVVYLPSLKFSLLIKLLAIFCFFKLFGFQNK